MGNITTKDKEEVEKFNAQGANFERCSKNKNNLIQCQKITREEFETTLDGLKPDDRKGKLRVRFADGRTFYWEDRYTNQLRKQMSTLKKLGLDLAVCVTDKKQKKSCAFKSEQQFFEMYQKHKKHPKEHRYTFYCVYKKTGQVIEFEKARPAVDKYLENQRLQQLQATAAISAPASMPVATPVPATTAPAIAPSILPTSVAAPIATAATTAAANPSPAASI